VKTLNQFALGLAIASVLTVAAYGDGFTATGNMAYPRWNHTATRLLDGRVLVVAGRDADEGPTATAELYNPATGTWTTTSSLNNGEDREFHTATLLPNGKVLVAGGLHQSAYTYLAYSGQVYDPANGTWSSGGPSGFYGHTATLLPSGKVLIVGGTGIQGSGPYRSALLYDPAGSSSYTGSLGNARYLHTATLLTNGKVLVAGGVGTNGTVLTSAELYNPATGTWSPAGNPGASGIATLLPNGKVLAVGGTNAELYDPATGTWSPTGSPGTAHYDDSALLPNGKVLFVEDSLYNPLGSAGLYDPANGTWPPAGDPGTSGTATLLLNGKVLVAGVGASLYESSLNPTINPVRLTDGSFQFGFSNPSGVSYHILASANLAAPLNTWSNLGTATETPSGSGHFLFTDHQAMNYPNRFYRVSSP
jgi:hypothetical protein